MDPKPAEHDHEEMKRVMAQAVAEGIRQILSDPDFWQEATSAMKRHAANATGNFILDAAAGLWRKALWSAVILLALYSTGGLSAVMAAAKTYLLTK